MRRWLTAHLPNRLAWIAVGVATVAIVGITDPVFGGLGKALFWIGVVAAPAIFGVALAIGALGEKHPEIFAPLSTLWRGGLQFLAILVVVLAVQEWQCREADPLPHIRFTNPDPMTHLQRPDPVLAWRGA